jgi:elongation factor P
MADTSDIKNGLCIELDGGLYKVLEFLHVKPGKGGAFVRTKLKNIENKKVIDKTFNAGVKIEIARIESLSFQYLYKDSSGFNFINNETFEQIVLDEDMIENNDLLKENENVEIILHTQSGKYLMCKLPDFVNLKVVSCENAIKGATVNRVMKTATMETGAEIQVPLFIENEEMIKIDTTNRSYIERSKKKSI